jgi:hypothetical protein
MARAHHIAQILAKRSANPHMHGDISTIQTLFRAPDSLTLWGLPYKMNRAIGQSPRDLFKAHGGARPEWIYLGGPGWFGSMRPARVRKVKAFLTKYREFIPGSPYEWDEIS